MNKIENQISYDIRGAIFEVYNTLGPGLFESVYETALYTELKNAGYNVAVQTEVPVRYKGISFDKGFRMDLLIDEKVIVELKSVKTIEPVHKKQLLTYLKLANKKLGILVNFNTSNISNSIIRIANDL